jgi:hypothetical protein
MVAELLGRNSKFHYRVHKIPSLDFVLNRSNSVHMLTPYFLKKNYLSPIRVGLASGLFLCLTFSGPLSSTSSKILGCIFLLLRCDPQTLIVVLLFCMLSCSVQCTNCSVTRSLPLPRWLSLVSNKLH